MLTIHNSNCISEHKDYKRSQNVKCLGNDFYIKMKKDSILGTKTSHKVQDSTDLKFDILLKKMFNQR